MRLKGIPPAAKFAVVINPGTLFEAVDQFASTMLGAFELANDLRADGMSVDVMRITPAGELTTEL